MLCNDSQLSMVQDEGTGRWVGGGGAGGLRSVSVRYKETPRGSADPMQAPGPNPCPALRWLAAWNPGLSYRISRGLALVTAAVQLCGGCQRL